MNILHLWQLVHAGQHGKKIVLIVPDDRARSRFQLKLLRFIQTSAAYGIDLMPALKNIDVEILQPVNYPHDEIIQDDIPFPSGGRREDP